MTSYQTSNEPWEKLLENNLNDWAQQNDLTNYELKDGVIVGTKLASSPNDDSYLYTKANYKDFILEFDSWFELNSGVHIRGKNMPDFQDGHTYGYQIVQDPSKRAWTGSIYEESRGYLYPLELNPEGKMALKIGEWNHFRIETVGKSIRTWVNGIPCADLIDDMTSSGFIGLSVHGIDHDSTKIGKVVKWKNMRIITKDVEKYLTPYEPLLIQTSFLTNKLSEREVNEGWKLLWDGQTTDGWHGAKLTTFPTGGWEIKDGVLSVIENGGTKSANGGDIVIHCFNIRH